jgi:hypothetical protein
MTGKSISRSQRFRVLGRKMGNGKNIKSDAMSCAAEPGLRYVESPWGLHLPVECLPGVERNLFVLKAHAEAIEAVLGEATRS